MLKLLHIFIVAILAQSLPHIEGSSGPYWSSNTSNYEVHKEDWSSSVHSRLKRENEHDNLKAQLERLQRVARIVNGISIRLGLIRNAITSEDLIAELLFFGPTKPSEIIGMDSAPIEKSIGELKNLPGTLISKDSKVTEAEKVLTDMGRILEAIDGIGNKGWEKGDLEKWDYRYFFAEVTGLSNGNFTLPKLMAFLRKKAGMNWFKELMGTDTIGSDDLNPGIDIINRFLTRLKGLSNNMETTPIHRFQVVSAASDTIETLLKAAKGASIVNEQKKAIELTPEQKSAYINFLATFPKPSYKDAQTKLTIVKDLMKRQLEKSRSRELKITPGLSNGLIDFSALFYDFQDPFIESIVDAKSAEIALKELEFVKSPLRKVGEDLAFKEDDIKLIESLIEAFHQIDSIDTSKITKGLNEAERSPIPWSDIETKDVEDIVKVGELLESVDNKLARINSLIQEIRGILKSKDLMKWADEVIKICEGAASAPDPQQTLKTFREYRHLKKLRAEIVKVFDKLQEIQDVQKDKKINEEANEALQLSQQFKSFHKHIKANYATSFKNLLATKSLKTASEMVEIIQKLRSFKADTDNAKAIVKKVIGTKNDLTKATQMIESLKAGSIKKEFLELMRNDVSKHSEIIGNSIRGMSNMHNALSQKILVEDVLKKLQVVKTSQNLLNDAGDVKNLKDLFDLESSIRKMLTDLEAFNKKVPAIDSVNLKDYYWIFFSAESIPGVNANFSKVSDAVWKLKEKVRDPEDQKTLDEVASALKTMEPMGLNFASYKKHFSVARPSLIALNQFFFEFTMRMMPTTTAKPTHPAQTELVSTTQPRWTRAFQKPEIKENPYNSVLFVMLVFCLVLLWLIVCSKATMHACG